MVSIGDIKEWFNIGLSAVLLEQAVQDRTELWMSIVGASVDINGL